jgi:hypothetical protein
MIFNYEIDGQTFMHYRKPCIYAWFRGSRCLYVGMSIHGIMRPIGKHHVIDEIEVVRKEDTLKLFFPPVRDADELAAVEKLYIKKLEPELNQTNGCETNGNSRLPEHHPQTVAEYIKKYPEYAALRPVHNLDLTPTTQA